jgi:hypothetical protein
VGATDLLRSSRDGDQFHYTWAARQALQLLDEQSGLHALYVEGVDPSEMPPAGSTPEGKTTDVNQVIDLTEYYGSNDIRTAERVIYRQLKHSTVHANDEWTMSFIETTLVGFARKYRSLLEHHPESIARVVFEFVSNRPPARSAEAGLRSLATASPLPAARKVRTELLTILNLEQLTDFVQKLSIDERAPALLRLRHLFDLQVADLLPGAPGDQALLLREMISSRASSIHGHEPAVHRADVLAALKTSEDQLLPSPNLIEPVKNLVKRRQFGDIAQVLEEAAQLTVVHGSGGVGKSTLSTALADHLPSGSITLVYDCFGNGSYRRPSTPRHRPRQACIQLVNELASRTLCDPLIPSATAEDSDYLRAFSRRLEDASEALSANEPGALLVLVVDAADNAQLVADEVGERSFCAGLVREPLPSNVRLVLTCRTERLDLLGLPPRRRDIELTGFDLLDTRASLEAFVSNAAEADIAEFHVRTSGNPRVQRAILASSDSLAEALEWLGPTPPSSAALLETLMERQVAELRDTHQLSRDEIDAICVGLAALRPMIPLRVLGELAGVQVSAVASFVADLGRPLLIDGHSVQFRDEPSETWFRKQYRPQGAQLQAFISRIAQLADDDAYVAASLPSLLYEAGRLDALVDLALSDDKLPGGHLPAPVRNEVQRREISQQRTHFALAASLRDNRDLEAAMLTLRLGQLTAGRGRRLRLLRDHTDLTAQYLDGAVLEHLIATRSLVADWPNSNLGVEGALLACVDGQGQHARNRLRSAVSWITAWSRQSSEQRSGHRLEVQDIFQVAWGLLNTDGPNACLEFLLRWRPRSVAFEVVVEIGRRLQDSGRQQDFNSLARATQSIYVQLALSHVCAERDASLPRATLKRTISNLKRRTLRVDPTDRDDHQRSNDGLPIHHGLTAVSWLLLISIHQQLVEPAIAARILRTYLPDSLGHRTGGQYGPDVWQLILGFSLLARLEGRTLAAEDIEGPTVKRARDRARFESSSTLREFQANVEPLLTWADAWISLVLAPETDGDSRMQSLIEQLAKSNVTRWTDERIDYTLKNTALAITGSAMARKPGLVSHATVLEFATSADNGVSRRSLIHFVRQTATNPQLRVLSGLVAKHCHKRLADAREDAGDRADEFIRLARATGRISTDEASVHFQAALQITDAIGDDAWERWNALLAITRATGEVSAGDTGRAYRLGQIAEGVEPYLGDHLDHPGVIATAASLSLPEALATASRWRDRRFASPNCAVDGLLRNADNLLNERPDLILSLLPLGKRLPDHRNLAHALATSSMDATNAIITYLRYTRAEPLDPAVREELIELSGATRDVIHEQDSSLLWPPAPGPVAPAGSAAGSAGEGRPHDRPFSGELLELDLSSAQAWSRALDVRSRPSIRDLFDDIADRELLSPVVLRAFRECTTVTYWDFQRLLDAAAKQPLTMATQRVLEEVLVDLVARFASDIMLNTWNQFDFDSARALTGRDVDFEHVASRTLASRASFTSSEAYALATRLVQRLRPDDRLQLFDTAADLFRDVAPCDSADGSHPDGMTVGIGDDEAVASTIWTALGDTAIGTRWLATHCTQLALSLGSAGVASKLHDLAAGRLESKSFRDARLYFYSRHATQWLLMGIKRSLATPVGVRATAVFASWLREVAEGVPHAANTPHARDALLALHEGGYIVLSDRARRDLNRRGRPVGTVQRTWDAPAQEVRQLQEVSGRETAVLRLPDSSATAKRTGPEETDPFAIPLLVTAADQQTTSDATNEASRAPDEERYRFFFDFEDYWCRPVGDAFGIEDKSIEIMVARIILGEWGVTSRGEAENDERHNLRIYQTGSYVHKGDWPQEDDLDFYWAVQALQELAGRLLASRPVVQRYQEDIETGASEYRRVLEDYLPARSDGFWLADRRDPRPRHELLDESAQADGRTSSATDSWVYGITSDRFSREVAVAPDQFNIWGSEAASYYGKREHVDIRSALVSPSTAHALLRALQTAPDSRAYRLPDAADDDYVFDAPGFSLQGWILSSGHVLGLDRHDATGRQIAFPPPRPSTTWLGVSSLAPDADMRVWKLGSTTVAVSNVWDSYIDDRENVGGSGESLIVDKAWLKSFLRENNKSMIIEVKISRHDDSARSLRRRTPSSDEEDQDFEYLAPYTRYFLLDSTGALDGLR